METTPHGHLGRPVDLPYAGFGRRLGAFLLDWLLVYAVLFVAGAVWITQRVHRSRDAWLLLLYPLVFLGGWLYWAGLESSSLQATLGKRALGLIVTDIEGRRVSFGRATMRYFAKLFSGMILYIGFLMAAFTARRQALHDMIAGTLVVLGNPRPQSPGPEFPKPPEPPDMVQPFYR